MYHIYSRGNNKAKIFDDPSDYESYLSIIRQKKDKFHFSFFHFCLMPNHIHLLLRPNSHCLPELMHGINNAYSKYYCKKYDFVGHVWQGRYKCKRLDTDAYLFACGNYIEMNPVRAGLTSKPEDWPYSSFRHYGLGIRSRLLDKDPFYDSLAPSAEERQNIYYGSVDKTRIN